jgi:hypothetical protein
MTTIGIPAKNRYDTGAMAIPVSIAADGVRMMAEATVNAAERRSSATAGGAGTSCGHASRVNMKSIAVRQTTRASASTAKARQDG